MFVISGVPNQWLKLIICILGLIATVAILLAVKPIETNHYRIPSIVHLNP